MQVLAFSIPGFYEGGIFNKLTPPPKGRLALPGAVPIKFLSISHRYFPSTFKLRIINL